jgi:hypothetical protein
VYLPRCWTRSSKACMKQWEARLFARVEEPARVSVETFGTPLEKGSGQAKGL